MGMSDSQSVMVNPLQNSMIYVNIDIVEKKEVDRCNMLRKIILNQDITILLLQRKPYFSKTYTYTQIHAHTYANGKLYSKGCSCR